MQWFSVGRDLHQDSATRSNGQLDRPVHSTGSDSSSLHRSSWYPPPGRGSWCGGERRSGPLGRAARAQALSDAMSFLIIITIPFWTFPSGVRLMQAKKSASRHKPLTRKDARSAVRAAQKTSAGRHSTRSKAWEKGGAQYSRVLGHFGLTSSHSK